MGLLQKHNKMKINMAETDYFNVGMIVCCTTYYGKKIQGEVMAFDYHTKMLVLKTPSKEMPTKDAQGSHDIQIINLNMVTSVDSIKEAASAPPPLTNLNTSKIATRLKQHVEEKTKAINYVGVGVSPIAQSLLDTISRQYAEVVWQGDNIVVLDQVVIGPPYGVDNCKINGNGDKPTLPLFQQVKKIVEKYHRDNGKNRDSVQRELERESSVSST